MSKHKKSDLDHVTPHFDEDGKLTFAHDFCGMKRGDKVTPQAELSDSFRIKIKGKVVYVPKLYFGTVADGVITKRPSKKELTFQSHSREDE